MLFFDRFRDVESELYLLSQHDTLIGMARSIPDIGGLFIPKDMGPPFIRKLIIFLILAIIVILMGFGISII